MRVFDISSNPYLGGDYPLWLAGSAAALSESYRAKGIAPASVLDFQTQGGKPGLLCPDKSSANTLDAQGVIAIQNLGFTCYDQVQKTDVRPHTHAMLMMLRLLLLQLFRAPCRSPCTSLRYTCTRHRRACTCRNR